MGDIYWGLFFTLIGGVIAVIKEWKDKSEKKYLRENIIAVISFILILFGELNHAVSEKMLYKANILAILSQM